MFLPLEHSGERECESVLSRFLQERTLSPLVLHSPGWHSHAPTACTSSPGAKPGQRAQARPPRAARRFSSATKPSRRTSASPRMMQRASSAYPLPHSSKYAASLAFHAGRTCGHASRQSPSACGKLPGLRSTRKRRKRGQRRQTSFQHKDKYMSKIFGEDLW